MKKDRENSPSFHCLPWQGHTLQWKDNTIGHVTQAAVTGTTTSQELLRDFIHSDEFHIIHQETRDAIKNEFGNHLDELESAVQSLTETQGTMRGLESSMDFSGQRLDDLQQTALPAVAQNIKQIASQLALQTLNIDIHLRKWSLMIQGLKGAADEDEDTTRQACVRLAKEHIIFIICFPPQHHTANWH